MCETATVYMARPGPFAVPGHVERLDTQEPLEIAQGYKVVFPAPLGLSRHGLLPEGEEVETELSTGHLGDVPDNIVHVHLGQSVHVDVGDSGPHPVLQIPQPRQKGRALMASDQVSWDGEATSLVVTYLDLRL